MTKSGGQKIGGRYYLSGGDLKKPTYVYAESIEQLVDPAIQPKYSREITQDWGTFKEYTFI